MEVSSRDGGIIAGWRSTEAGPEFAKRTKGRIDDRRGQTPLTPRTYDLLMARKWFHITFSTYGTWLPGDARGFRSRHHRLHSSGNYKTRPPAGEHAALRSHVQARMKNGPVTLTPKQRVTCGRAIIEKLREKGCEVIAAAVAARHAHIQARAEDGTVKQVVGFAKQAASHRLRNDWPGKIWAAGCRTSPIRDRAHQEKLFRYIVGHRDEAAFVWTFRDGEVGDESGGRSG